METIKLLIWDLDHTFWDGTLSEGPIRQIPEHLVLIRQLTARGIMNSIVSKNSLQAVRNILQQWDIWDYFIFPSISWEAKGERIGQIIADCRLRPDNVLFLDDNPMNRNEAGYYNPGLHTAAPDFIRSIPSHRAFQGKDDSGHSRLRQYKILEKKDTCRRRYAGPIDFLRDCHIKISRITDPAGHRMRIRELIGRAHQLNYTKTSLESDELDRVLADPRYTCAAIQIRDDYGDYGIVGFYALDRQTHTLIQFVFSCRILNLGVPQYIFSALSFPRIEIIPEVAEPLDRSTPDWIQEESLPQPAPAAVPERRRRILLKGGCDLKQVSFYLGKNTATMLEETNYVSNEGIPIHQEHTEVLLGSLTVPDEVKRIFERQVPFVDRNFYRTQVFNAQYDCLIYSVLMDYTQQLYRHRKHQIILPFGGYDEYWTDRSAHERIVETLKKQGIHTVSLPHLQWFAQEFEHLGRITPSAFTANLGRIRRRIPVSIPIIFLNAAEVASPEPVEKSAEERHRYMNAALDAFIRNAENVHLVDVRTIISRKEELSGNIRHYQRTVYRTLAAELLKKLHAILDRRIRTRPVIPVRELMRIAFPAATPHGKAARMLSRLFRNNNKTN